MKLLLVSLAVLIIALQFPAQANSPTEIITGTNFVLSFNSLPLIITFRIG